jgi:hypothetical protein
VIQVFLGSKRNGRDRPVDKPFPFNQYWQIMLQLRKLNNKLKKNKLEEKAIILQNKIQMLKNQLQEERKKGQYYILKEVGQKLADKVGAVYFKVDNNSQHEISDVIDAAIKLWIIHEG